MNHAPRTKNHAPRTKNHAPSTMKTTSNNKEKEKILNNISGFIDRNYIGVTCAYIFGSFLTSEKYSDLDIGVFTAEETEDVLGFELALETELEMIAKCPVDVRVLNHSPISFSQSVIRSGRVIVDRDPSIRAEVESRVLRLYFDFAPFRKRYLKEVGDAPI